MKHPKPGLIILPTLDYLTSPEGPRPFGVLLNGERTLQGLGGRRLTWGAGKPSETRKEEKLLTGCFICGLVVSHPKAWLKAMAVIFADKSEG